MDFIEPPEALPVGESLEVAPGVVMERRCFFTSVAAIFAAAAVPGVATAQLARPANERVTYEEFLQEAVPVAKKLVADVSATGQARYLHAVASCALRLSDVPQPEWRDSGQGAGPGTLIGVNPGGDPFTVLHWRMQPGSAIRLHAHTYGNVVTLGLAGEVRVRNFEMAGARDFEAKNRFQVRATVNQLLGPGEVNLVNLERNYIHGTEAGRDGGRGLDITTRIREKARIPYLDLGKEPIDAQRGIYEGSWVS